MPGAEKKVDEEQESRLDGGMKARTSFLTLALFLAAGTVCFASPQMGTWKLNEAKSKITPRLARNTRVVYKNAFWGKVRVITDGVDGKGQPTHNEWTGKFNGQDYPVTGDPTSDMRSYKKVDDSTMILTNKKAGKIVGTRTITTNAKGKKFKNLAVYDGR